MSPPPRGRRSPCGWPTLLLAALTVAGCGDSERVLGVKIEFAWPEVRGPDAVVLLHDRVPLVAKAQGGVRSGYARTLYDSRDSTGSFHWESSDTTVARVGPDGAVTFVAVGRAEVVAGTLGLRSEPIRFRVSPHFARFVLSPVDTVAAVGDTVTFVATALDSNGAAVALVPVVIGLQPTAADDRQPAARAVVLPPYDKRMTPARAAIHIQAPGRLVVAAQVLDFVGRESPRTLTTLTAVGPEPPR